uniref:Uncharacterized protein n=1 Tax=Timema cristinae TaxID=61476 RepID=A0A7R9DBM7_TIMCR|nr:unnamed protein product [Timema cristinae]
MCNRSITGDNVHAVKTPTISEDFLVRDETSQEEFSTTVTSSGDFIVTLAKENTTKTHSNITGKKRATKRVKESNSTSNVGWVELEMIDNKSHQGGDKIDNIHIDDIFNEMEIKLRHKINKKLITLKKRMNINNAYTDMVEDEDALKSINISKAPSLEMKKSLKHPVIDEELTEIAGKENPTNISIGTEVDEIISVWEPKKLEKERSVENRNLVIDPNDYLKIKPKYLRSEHPDLSTRGDEGIDDEEDEEEMKMYNIVSEAFADDNVVADFSQEKKEAVIKSTPQNIDLSMPGWGDWAGQNLSVSKRKKRRFVIKVPKDAPRRDENKGNVIINQEKDSKVKQHQSPQPACLEQLSTADLHKKLSTAVSCLGRAISGVASPDASLNIGSKRDAQPTVLIGQESTPKPPTPLKDHMCKPQVHLSASRFSY